MLYEMQLRPKPFERIRNGQKTIELRLFDEKRRSIQPDDTIRFTCTEPPHDTLTVQVLSLAVFPDFAALYAAFYTPNVLLHLDNGKPDPVYDWYHFLAFGLNTIWIVIPLLLLISWCLALGIWASNKKIASK